MMINFHFKPARVHFGDRSQYCPQDSHMDYAQTVKVMITYCCLLLVQYRLHDQSNKTEMSPEWWNPAALTTFHIDALLPGEKTQY